jgi:hypothetical protein
MRNMLNEASHLIRLAVLVLACIGLFLIVRAAVVPKGFGAYGHYRPAALDEIRTRPTVFAGQTECLLCHEDQAKVKAAGRHQKVNCEACHGPLASHVADPSGKPKITDVPALCTGCHERDSAKPAGFPQVVSKEHSGGAPCEACHQPHTPRLQ